MRHIPALRRIKRADLQAVCDLDQDLAASVAESFGIPNAYGALDGMLSQENLDVVEVCTPPRTHVTVAIPAMKAGCHVLLEKPMALDVKDCDKMIGAAKKHGIKLGVVHNNLFNRGFLRLKNLIKDGAIGEVTTVSIYWTTPPDEMLSQPDHWAHDLPGGLIGETGPHLAYLALSLMGEVTDVNVQATDVLGYGWAPFDNYTIALRGNGVLSAVSLSYANASNAAWIDVGGTDGVLHLDMLSRIVFRYQSSLNARSVAAATGSMVWQTVAGMASSALHRVLGRDKAGYGHETAIRSFFDSVSTGEEIPVSGADGRETTELVQEIVGQLRNI
jgi:predicted dehydrogenase